MNTLIKFSANWCGPCAALSTVLKTIDLSSIKMIEIDVDKQSELVHEHCVRALPTLVLVNSETNAEIKRCTGVKTKEQLLQFLGLTE